MFDRDYDLFAQVVEAGSLSAAGRRMRISPAMVSKRLAQLESRLGTRLIHRTTRRLALTEAGEIFHGDIVAVLGAARAAEARVSGQERQMAGALRISAPTSFGRLYVAPYLKAFLDEHPRVSVQLDLSDAFTDLIGERIDVAIRIASTIGPGLVAHRLGDSPRVLCAAPAYLEQQGRPDNVADLARHHLLAAMGQLPWRLDGPGGATLIEGESRVRTNSSEVVRELTLAGAGVALRSLWDVEHDIAQGRLARVLPAYAGSSDAGIYAVYPRAAQAPASVGAFIAYLRRLYAPAAPWEA
jgi:DNA-binding transcriptional LysR family regulator